jgi:RNA polymerase sigma factor (sigma-70 family)
LPDSDIHPAKTALSAVEIYRNHSTFIRKIIGVHIKDESQAEDMFQDFFLSLVENPLPENITYIESYLYRAVINCIVDATRQTRRHQAGLHRYARQRPSVGTIPRPEKPVINAEEAARMFHLVEMLLPENQADAVRRRYKDGCDIREVSEAMGLDTKSVSRYISAGLGKIHRILAVGEGRDI